MSFSFPGSSTSKESYFLAALLRSGNEKKSLCNSTRPLTEKEIGILEKQGNSAFDWSRIRVVENFTTLHIRNNRFLGTCFLGFFSGATAGSDSPLPLPTGIYDSTIIDSTVSGECCIWSVRGLNNYYIGGHCFLHDIGSLACSPSACFGNGREIVIGMETGGREVPSFADITIDTAYSVCKRRDRETIDSLSEFIRLYTDHCRIGYGVVEPNTRLSNCAAITDTYIGSAARCSNVTGIHNATLLSSPEEPVEIHNGAFVRNSCVQWGCHIDTMAIVDNALLTEHSRVELHGKVTHSILGPNTKIAEGEVTASLVGPFVGFHHQSLLIGALWPEGKGNVAYGANIGSNHTSKAPDQEIYCGEGMFFGLGSNIKFPSDFSRAPYSIIATGITTLPQRMTFPFSLINAPAACITRISPAFNELIPGWVLSDNLYAIKRNEGKYKKRNKARRSAFSFDVFRPEIIDMLLDARNLLRDATVIKEYYLESDIEGIGKNYVTRKNLLGAIETYSEQIEYYCLEGLYQQCTVLIRGNIPVTEQAILTTPSDDPFWTHRCDLCRSEGVFNRQLRENLERFALLVERSTQKVLAAKEKDDVRGRKIAIDYDSVHTAAHDDEFVKKTIAGGTSLQQEIDTVSRHLP